MQLTKEQKKSHENEKSKEATQTLETEILY